MGLIPKPNNSFSIVTFVEKSVDTFLLDKIWIEGIVFRRVFCYNMAMKIGLRKLKTYNTA